MLFVLPVYIENIRDWIEIIVSVAIPVLIMAITLIFSKREQRKALKQQDNEHKEILISQKETDRMSIMPVFDVVSIVGKLETTKPSNTAITRHIFDIHLKNVGGGVAMCTYTEWTNGSNEVEYHPVYEDNYASYTCYKEFQYDNTIATIGKEINVMLIRKTKEAENAQTSENSIILPICYYDLIGNHYKQSIVIRFRITDKATGEIEPFNIMPLPPNLIENNQQKEEKTNA